MPGSLKLNTVLVAGLAGLFYWSFMFAKHNPALRDIIPFGNDPYDAVGSFGVIVGPMAAVLALVRAFRPYRERRPSSAEHAYLVRCQEAVVLVVLITLAADTVAMIRHPQWYSAPSHNSLIVLLGTLAVISVGLHVLVRGSREASSSNRQQRPQAVVAALIAVLVLVIYPERLIDSTATHLLSVIIGAAILFAPMRPLLAVLVPFEDREMTAEPGDGSSLRARYRWGVVSFLGALLGCLLFVGEMSEGNGTSPAGRAVYLASIFVGLAMAGLLMAYAFLGVPLGLARRRTR